MTTNAGTEQGNTEGQNTGQNAGNSTVTNEGQNSGQNTGQTPPKTYTQEEFDAVVKQAKDAQGDTGRVLDLYKSTVLGFLPADKRAEAEALLKTAEEEAGRSKSQDEMSARELNIRARELALEYSEYGVKAEDLAKDAKDATELETRALRAKLEYLEKNGKPNPGSIPSDKGGAGQGGGNGQPKYPKIEGKGEQAILNHFREIREQKAASGKTS